jgi:putative Holliday junction resolvase
MMIGKRILALDPGSKRMGVALSDELGWTAQPLETYERRSVEADVAHIQDLVRQHDVREVVMGMPLHMNGQVGSEAKHVQKFMVTLERALSVPVIAWDERLTTKEAEDILIAANVSRKKRKGAVDRVAAAILLQSYLESHSSHGAVPDRNDVTDGGL